MFLVEGVALGGGVTAFVEYWSGREGGQERANFPRFLIELCDVLGVDRPEAADATHQHNDYVFERHVERTRADGSRQAQRIDLYKRDCFILEAKQSRLKGPKRIISGQTDLFASDSSPDPKSEVPSWDVLMVNARRQAQNYARALPEDHAYPPFILTCDVGRVIEVFADFSGTGRHYSHFPDAQSFQIHIDNLSDPEIQDRLRRVWTDPKSLDPAKQTAKVTREIAGQLAEVSMALEDRGIDPGAAALLLMRCLFTMFVEDVGLLKEGSFTELLALSAENPRRFAPDMEHLWEQMDRGGYSPAIGDHLLRFNGKLFKNAKAFPLEKKEVLLLKSAAEADWRDLEPAIFGTLFERALDPSERRRLGAHYTPRAYVERLVNATIMEPLNDDWAAVESNVERVLEEGSRAAAIKDVEDFLKDLSKVRVLDPACGTGNFLYVALKQMKELEGKVLSALRDLGGDEAVRNVGNISVKPHQFFGFEINQRAVKIAELVLWVGYIQWHLRARGNAPEEPILDDKEHVRYQDALLTWEGWPIPAVVSGQEVYAQASPPVWPEADFIVGNPPFIGKGEAMRSALGDAYLQALWKKYKSVNRSADYVMFWWARAGEILADKTSRLRRYGFVTTNSITQLFNRRVVQRHLDGKNPLSIVFAIPDHPWTKATRDAASVRIAMTVVSRGEESGVLREVVEEKLLDTDKPDIQSNEKIGCINSDLTVGVDTTKSLYLLANRAIACNGMMLAGQGFVVNQAQRDKFIRVNQNYAHVVRPFIKGGDLIHNSSSRFVIDLFGMGREDARRRFPAIYQYLLDRVKPERDKKRDRAFREKWWLFGRQRPEIRSGIENLSRYIGTTETAKHRIFRFLEKEIVPDHMIIAISLEDAFFLGVLSSKIHVKWSLRVGGWLGVGNDPRYSKSQCFDPFPFPETTETIKDEIRELAEELNETRKSVLAQDKTLTLTGLYNVLEKLKFGEKLTSKDEDIKTRGRVLILKDLHEQIDAAVFRAYGWEQDISDEEILAKLVALNADRAAEERRGFIRWLRPDYQIPKFGELAHKADKVQSISVGQRASRKSRFPKDARKQTTMVIAALRKVDMPLTASNIASSYENVDQAEVEIREILSALQRTGVAVSFDDGRSYISAA